MLKLTELSASMEKGSHVNHNEAGKQLCVPFFLYTHKYTRHS
jgi:hypothetical protein